MAKKGQNIINKIVKKIANTFHPNKIILFGSYAKGKPQKDSDLDFLVIKPSNLRRDKRDHEIRKSLTDIIFPMDIFVYTPEEIAKYKNLPGSFISKILKAGKILYESK